MHHLIVVSSDGILTGVLSSLDVARELVLEGKAWPYTREFLLGID